MRYSPTSDSGPSTSDSIDLSAICLTHALRYTLPRRHGVRLKEARAEVFSCAKFSLLAGAGESPSIYYRANLILLPGIISLVRKYSIV